PGKRRTEIRHGRVALLAVALLLAWLAAGRTADPAIATGHDLASGSLVIAGGGDLPDGAGDRFLELAGGRAARVVVIPTATECAEMPELLDSPTYWKQRGAASVVLLHTRSRQRANDPAFVKPLTEATGVWMTGGDQVLLAEAYNGTLVERELQR